MITVVQHRGQDVVTDLVFCNSVADAQEVKWQSA